MTESYPENGPNTGEQPKPLTAELIESRTQFSLAMTFTGFAREDSYVSPDLHEERERLSEQFGEDNVLPSFFVDENGVVQLGLFLRKTPEVPATEGSSDPDTENIRLWVPTEGGVALPTSVEAMLEADSLAGFADVQATRRGFTPPYDLQPGDVFERSSFYDE